MHSSQQADSDSAQYFTCYLNDEAATLAMGAAVSSVLHAGLTIYLNGTLGAGKTTFVRGILHGLGYHHVVKSPTYNLVEIYKISRLYLYHFDFYRFNDPIEWEEAGFREYFNSESICFVEWAKKAGELLPTADLQIFIDVVDQGRQIKIKTGTQAGKLCLIQLQKQKYL